MTRRILGILAIILALAMALPASAALTVVQQWAPTSQGVWPAAKGTVWAKTAVTSIVGVSTTATVTMASTTGMTNGDQVYIQGSSISADNGFQTVAALTGTTWTFTTASTAARTGTITAQDFTYEAAAGWGTMFTQNGIQGTGVGAGTGASAGLAAFQTWAYGARASSSDTSAPG